MRDAKIGMFAEEKGDEALSEQIIKNEKTSIRFRQN